MKPQREAEELFSLKPEKKKKNQNGSLKKTIQAKTHITKRKKIKPKQNIHIEKNPKIQKY